ncbi:MAG: LD-carboxypeptidase [Patescibacteria group bacterium]
MAFVSQSVALEERSRLFSQVESFCLELGVVPVFGKGAIANYSESGARTRAGDINDFFSDSDVKCILMADGGGLSIKTLPYLNYDLIKSNPKLLCAFSDSSTLANAIYANTGLPAILIPSIASALRDPSGDIHSLYEKALF